MRVVSYSIAPRTTYTILVSFLWPFCWTFVSLHLQQLWLPLMTRLLLVKAEAALEPRPVCHQNPPRTLSYMSSPAITSWRPMWPIVMGGPAPIACRVPGEEGVTTWHYGHTGLSWGWGSRVRHQTGGGTAPGMQCQDTWGHSTAPLLTAFHGGLWTFQALGGQSIAGLCPSLCVEVLHQ